MANPTTRVLSLLELLQTHGLLSGAELAERLGVHARTLRRYVQQLEELGVPLATVRGRDGGYRLMQGFKLPPMMFTNEEALAIGVGLRAVEMLGVASDGSAAASALAKIERVLPPAVQEKVRAVTASISIDIPVAANAGASDMLAELSQCMHAQQSMMLSYRARDDATTERMVDPYAIAFYGGNWYVVGYCHLRLNLRSFRLDRIVTVKPQPRSFAAPKDFDASAYLQASIASLARTYHVEVRLKASLELVRTVLPHSLGIYQVHEEGITMHSEVEELEWMARILAGLPFSFEIVTPEALKSCLRHHLENVLAQMVPAAQ